MKIKKRLYTALALVVLVVLALVWGVHWWQTGRFFEETDNAYVHADSVAVRAEVTGRVAEVAVADNQRVAAGDILVKLDPMTYRVTGCAWQTITTTIDVTDVTAAGIHLALKKDNATGDAGGMCAAAESYI